MEKTFKEKLATWWVAGRPFSFPASVIPVVFGSVAAIVAGGAAFKPVLFAASLIGIILLHAASNMLNDVYDYTLGLDSQVFPASGAVVRELLSPSAVLRGAILLFAAGSLLGLWVAYQATWHILWIGFSGILIGVSYSCTDPGLKYRGLGDLCVFLAFGMLGTLGGWTVQTENPSWIPIAWSVPIGLFIIAILHANNWRDIGSDSLHSSRSIASLLGDQGSLIYYAGLLFTPFLLVGVYTVVPRMVMSFPLPAMPLGSLCVVIALPLAHRLYIKGRQRAEAREDFVALDGLTAQLSMLFGTLLVMGFVAALIV